MMKKIFCISFFDKTVLKEIINKFCVAGHYLIFQANYKNSANMDCSPSFSHIESPWIEQSLPECVLQFNFTSKNYYEIPGRLSICCPSMSWEIGSRLTFLCF